MLEKRKVLDQIEIRANGLIFIRELNQVVDDGIVISSIPHRTSVCPLDDVSDSPYDVVRNCAAVVWTQEIKDAYLAEMNK